jgi:quinol monooxygenase YgiN
VAKVSVIARLTAKEGKRDPLVEALKELVAATEAEPGTQIYAMSVSTTEPEVVWFYELYTDQAGLAAHGGSDAMKAVGAKLAGLVAGAPELHVCDPVVAKGLPD